ncbi:Transcriptional regulator, MarR family [Enterococcus mundtii 3F]|uniref:MarR family winged helix-turn-helix transcriptional regulator n=1 Tax=Enterococcus TaxID=1350 RepID=UPI002302AE97|nr:MarR family winged helix-turn-helix transcriptional regulator [Enterococcus mundtii]MDA9462092.1 Transcriptional regulator, MarR family [Enterococcus mundtii 3F]
MNKTDILTKLFKIAQQPYLIFASNIEEKPDNTFETLKLLASEENVTAGRIAEYLDIKPSSVTQIIKKLESVKAVKRVKSDADARVTIVVLTNKGRESLSAQGNISNGFKDEIFNGFSDEELDSLNDYLERLENNISSEEFLDKIESIFGDDKNWEHFGKMSAKFGRAREQMMGRDGFGRFGGFGGFNGEYGGFEGWKKGRRK